MININLFDNDEPACPVCGEELQYSDSPVEIKCFVCKKTFKTQEYCHKGHFVCGQCRLGSAYEIITAFCLNSRETDPIALAVEIMDSPLIEIHGAEHHYIVPAVLLTAIHNKTSNPANLKKSLELAAEKAKKTPVNCTFHKGTCGAAIGTGIFLEVFTERNELMDEEFSLPNSLTAESLQRISHTPGPKCCKRDTYISIEETVKFLNEKFAVELPLSNAKCTFSLRNRTCGHEECNYYNVGLSIV